MGGEVLIALCLSWLCLRNSIYAWLLADYMEEAMSSHPCTHAPTPPATSAHTADVLSCGPSHQGTLDSAGIIQRVPLNWGWTHQDIDCA